MVNIHLKSKANHTWTVKNNSAKDAFTLLQQTECSQAEDVHKSSYNLANRNDTNSQVILNHHLLIRCGTKEVASAPSRTLSYSCWHWGKSRSGWSLQAWEHRRRVSWKAASVAWGPGGWTAWFASMPTAFPVACRRQQQCSWKTNYWDLRMLCQFNDHVNDGRINPSPITMYTA